MIITVFQNDKNKEINFNQYLKLMENWVLVKIYLQMKTSITLTPARTVILVILMWFDSSQFQAISWAHCLSKTDEMMMFKLYSSSVSLNEATMNCQVKRLLITKFQNEVTLKPDEVDLVSDSDDSDDEEYEDKWGDWAGLLSSDEDIHSALCFGVCMVSVELEKAVLKNETE